MSVTVRLNNLRIAPRKVRMVTDLIKGKTVQDAETLLNFLAKRSALPVDKLLKSGIATAKHDFGMDESNLYISKLFVDEGPKLKRWRARARGSAYEIQKKTSHITLSLDEIKKTGKTARKTILKNEQPVSMEAEPEKQDKVAKTEKSKVRPEFEVTRPKVGKGIRRIFRRKAI